MFAALDKNKDGQITLEEWEEYLKKSGLSAEKCEQLMALFKQLDTNADSRPHAAWPRLPIFELVLRWHARRRRAHSRLS